MGLSMICFGISMVFKGFNLRNEIGTLYSGSFVIIGIIMLILGVLSIFYSWMFSYVSGFEFYIIGVIFIILGVIGFLSNINRINDLSSIITILVGIASIAFQHSVQLVQYLLLLQWVLFYLVKVLQCLFQIKSLSLYSH